MLCVECHCETESLPGRAYVGSLGHRDDGPTLVSTPSPLFDGPTGVFVSAVLAVTALAATLGGTGLHPVRRGECLRAWRFVHKSPERGRTGHIAYKTIDM